MGDFDSLDPGAVGGMLAGLDGQQLVSLNRDHQEAALVALDADFLNAGAAGFQDIRSGGTSFDLLADLAGALIVDGAETFSSVVEDGGSPLQEAALDFFEGSLFENN